ncbi:MAG: HAD-IIIA family hydrolase [Chloroflexi bacterium]|nr:HAD-IIIA family hydrolase [Chloroflexota bacterium]
MKAVLFDFADTLATGVPCWEWPQIAACREQGLAVSPEAVKAAIRRIWGPIEGCAHPEASGDEAGYARWIGAIEAAILRELGLGAGADVGARRVMALQADPTSYRLFPEVPAVLAALRGAGLRLAIVSNNHWRLPELVAGLGIGPWFDAIVSSARVGYRKPRPEIFVAALDRLGVAPDEAASVGDDRVNDVEGAERVGLAAILLDRRRAANCQAIHDLRELRTILRRRAAGL